MDINEFEKLVARAVESLPDNIKDAMENIAIVVEDGPAKRNLLGLYEGIPENQWGKSDAIRLPDKITIFKSLIEEEARAPEEIKELVRLVVWHEIAHHFGFDEPQTRRLEHRWRARKP
ncbi:MAG: metallopeptidase family protein [Candidatus Nealsonbacteria bacterium DGGOD1a]|jgi:predicted Zn-dependent protease with MMP-like domain|nr:MAG: metallopeptidase family protein [Candidatus Nealsonbacteria bacterium DGGOD1a]